jgi:hypothetical protein
VERVASLGVALQHPAGWFGGARFRHFGEAPLIEDDSVRSNPTTVVNLEIGRRIGARFAVSLAAYNVLDSDDNDVHDQFFGSTTKVVFDAVVAGDADPAALVDAFAEAARQGRLLVWSRDQQAQALLSGTVLSGELTGRQGRSPVVGVYLEDAGGAKIGYYLEPTIGLEQTSCRPDGSQELALEVTLRSTAPKDAAELPSYLVGSMMGILPAGEIWTNVLVYAPSGGWIADYRASDGVVGMSSHTHDGLAVAARTVTLKPGAEVTMSINLVTGPGLSGVPALRSTPTALGEPVTVRAGRCG